VLLLNSPLNPCGTVMDPALLKPVCEAIVEENARREAAGERPLILIYDQVYWQIVFEGYTHQTPIHMVPEMAKYTVLVDAISKAWAGTGIRVGWAVAPPWIRDRMKALIGHMGAWAARAEQMATADLLADPDLVDPFMDGFKVELSDRLCALRDGFRAMRDRGCPVDCLDAQGAIYLSARLDLVGRTIRGREIKTDDDIRSVLLHEANVAVVPFSAFGYPDGTGWVRFSVGSVSMEDVQAALQNIERLFD
jgi:aspartate aminotransferase